MRFRFNIGKKIGAGFGTLLLFTLLVFALTYDTLQRSRKINDDITKIYNPSVGALEELNMLVIRSKMLISNWVFVQSSNDNQEKQNLRSLIYTEYSSRKKVIEKLAVHWSDKEQAAIKEIFKQIDNLFILHQDIMTQLNSFESYEDASVFFMIRPEVEGGEVDLQTSDILHNLSKIISSQHDKTNRESDKMQRSFDKLEFVVRSLGIGLLVGGMLIALFTVRMIVKPVQQLKSLLLLLGKGIIPEQKMKDRNDEIGEMSAALNLLVEGFKRTAGFAREVGSGNFKSEYHPLSENDNLGHSLIAMRKDLFELTSNLEQKVKERTEEVVRQKEEIELKNIEITASIRYAKRIQESILPGRKLAEKTLGNHFILYKPKDIVSGDFYWIEKIDGKSLFAAVDCTGHGVPGAFMSIIGNALLKEAVVEHKKTKPSDILNELNNLASETIKQTFEDSAVKDGMDIAFCALDFKKMELDYSGAYNPLYIIRKNEPGISPSELLTQTGSSAARIMHADKNYNLIEVKADKFPIGVFIGEELNKFTNHKIKLKKGDTIYVFSDGYADQFGGKTGKKFMAKRLRPMLVNIQHLSMDKQRDYLDATIEKWRTASPYSNSGGGEQQQVDDILMIGVRV